MNRVAIVVPDLELSGIRLSLWLVDVGRTVARGDRLVELLADGVTIDLPAPAAGRLVEQLVGEDEGIEVGVTLGWLAVEPLKEEP